MSELTNWLEILATREVVADEERKDACQRAADEIKRLNLAGFRLAQEAGGCDEIECSDPDGENCHCMETFKRTLAEVGQP